MPEGALGGLVGLLALLGAVAIVLRLLRAMGRATLRAAELAPAAGAAEASARRGDITGMTESRNAEARARAARRRDTLLALAWLAWLVLPLLLGAPLEAYALAAPLWLLPGQARSRRTG
jgi:hypothetical protein